MRELESDDINNVYPHYSTKPLEGQGFRALRFLREDLVYDAVLLGLIGAHEVVAVGVGGDFFDLLAGVLGEYLVQSLAELEDMAGGYLDIARHAFGAAGGLVDHHFGVRQREALTLLAAAQQNGAHRGGHTDAHRGNLRLDVVHRVQNGEASGDVAAGGVDIERDVFVGVFGSEKEELRNDEIRDITIDGAAQKDDALLEEAAIDIVGAFAERRFFDDHRDEHIRTGLFGVFHMPAS